ncbi:MAG: hypothetical protein AB9846_01530 [Tenuifilaceae bacterium]
MKNLILFSVLFFAISLIEAKAVRQDTIPVINFRAVDAITGTPVEMAHVINLNKRVGTIADMLGYFKLPVTVGDTISITSLGYFGITFFSWGQYKKDSTFYTIKLQPRSYHLKELQFSWFKDYDKFLRGVSQLKIERTKEEEQLENISDYFNRAIRKMALVDLPKGTSGIGFGKDWLQKQNEKLIEKLEKERQQRVIERKYSAGIVSALTGLTGNEVHWFMEYCALTDEFLLKASDYEIQERVMDKFKGYNKNKEQQVVN